jgi:hypothetical protein
MMKRTHLDNPTNLLMFVFLKGKQENKKNKFPCPLGAQLQTFSVLLARSK